jgi:PAS domain S-box-containing protein
MRNVSNKIKFTILGSILFPCFGRLALHGTGYENYLYRYLVPLLVGSLAGYLIGFMKDNWFLTINDLHMSKEALEKEIYERNHAKAALQETESSLESVFGAVPVGICFMKDRVYQRVNQNWCDSFGYSEEDLLGRTTEVLYENKEEYERVGKELYEQILEHGIALVHAKLKRSDDEFRDVDLIAKPLNSQDIANGTVVVIHDITDRKKAENINKVLFAISNAVNITENIDDLYKQIHNLAGEIIDVTNFFIAMVDIKKRTLYFPHHVDTTDDDFSPITNFDTNDSLTGLVVSQRRSILLKKNDLEKLSLQKGVWGPVPLIWMGAPLIAKDEVIGVVAVQSYSDSNLYNEHDLQVLSGISDQMAIAIDRKQAEEEKVKLEAQYRQAQKMESVGRLAGGVAHDYNNALTAIMGYTELAMMDADPNGQLHTHLKEVLKASIHAKDITRQLLAFARKQTIEPEVLDLNTSIESMLKMLQRLIGEDIDLAWSPGKNLWTVKMDPSQIDQILANLCVNAKDAIAGVGKITIETSAIVLDEAYCAIHNDFVPGEFVLMAISDNGCGMDKKIIDNIFEPFFTTKALDKGTGLGLSTVYGIVKQNNGFVNVYSEPGKGTTIKIYMHRHDGTTIESKKESTEEIPKGHGETILLVEDDISILTLIQKVLNGLGYKVLAANSPKRALKLAKEHNSEIHLLVTDVIMPEMNGLEMANRLQSLYPDLKRIFMSGYTANAIAHHGVLDEGIDFIQKPCSQTDLAKIVRKVLDEGKS